MRQQNEILYFMRLPKYVFYGFRVPMLDIISLSLVVVCFDVSRIVISNNIKNRDRNKSIMIMLDISVNKMDMRHRESGERVARKVVKFDAAYSNFVKLARDGYA